MQATKLFLLSLFTVFFSATVHSAPNTLPEGLTWVTNDSDPVYASNKAIKGGTLRSFMLSFPLTLRTVGPDSNTGIRDALLGNQMSLTGLHPVTFNPMPEIATHWAFDKDGVTTYYKLDQRARWSDGKPVTADDFLFTLEFMRSKHIVAPWYTDWYTNGITEVKKYDDHTIAITGSTPKPPNDLLYYYGMPPKPKHFHELNKDWVRNYNWKIEPNTGPYIITEIRKGKYIELERKKNWWAKDDRYNKNRFNVDKIVLEVIRDVNIAYTHFEKGDLDAFGLTLPNFWHDKATGELYDKGYIHKIWFYNQTPQPSYGLRLNQADPIFQDIHTRLGFAHAMNIDLMLKTVLRGDYERLNSKADGFGEYSNPDITAYPFDLKKADEYLSKAGWNKRGPDGIRVRDGKRLSATVLYAQPTDTERLVVLKEEAKKAGIELQLKLLDPSAAFKSMLEKKHQIAWLGMGGGIHPQYWESLHSDNAFKPQTNNFTNTALPELDELIMVFRNSTDHKERLKASRKILQIVHEQAAYIPTYKVPYVRSAYWRWMKLPKGYGTKRSESLFFPFNNPQYVNSGGTFWIDVEEKRKTRQAMKEGKSFEPVTIIDTTYKE